MELNNLTITLVCIGTKQHYNLFIVRDGTKQLLNQFIVSNGNKNLTITLQPLMESNNNHFIAFNRIKQFNRYFTVV